MTRRRLVGLLAMWCLVAVSISGCVKLQLTSPHAMFTASADAHVIPFTASFDATLSSNPNGEIVSYLWTFGDGGSDTGPLVDHTYSQAGLFDVTLTVFDENGRTAATSLAVQALNPLPTAEFSYSPRSVMEDNLVVSASEWITFDSSQSDDDGEIVSYLWNFGDGNEAEGPIVEHRWLWAGTYNVVLTVTDNHGDSSRCVQQVTVLGGTPCNTDITGDVPWSCQ